MKMPTDEQIDVAIEWLHNNEGDENDSHAGKQACEAVAKWLDHESRERMLRRLARDGGVTVAALRRRIADKPDTIDQKARHVAATDRKFGVVI
jgi:hypothetical protein